MLALERQAADRPSVWGAVRVVVDTDGTAADRPSPRLAEVMAGPPELPAVLGNLAPLLDHYGHLAIAGLITLEDSAVPAPGETVLIAGAVYARAGHLNIVAVVAIAVAAAVLGETSAMRSATSVGGRSCCWGVDRPGAGYPEDSHRTTH